MGFELPWATGSHQGVNIHKQENQTENVPVESARLD